MGERLLIMVLIGDNVVIFMLSSFKFVIFVLESLVLLNSFIGFNNDDWLMNKLEMVFLFLL